MVSNIIKEFIQLINKKDTKLCRKFQWKVDPDFLGAIQSFVLCRVISGTVIS